MRRESITVGWILFHVFDGITPPDLDVDWREALQVVVVGLKERKLR